MFDFELLIVSEYVVGKLVLNLKSWYVGVLLGFQGGS